MSTGKRRLRRRSSASISNEDNEEEKVVRTSHENCRIQMAEDYDDDGFRDGVGDEDSGKDSDKDSGQSQGDMQFSQHYPEVAQASVEPRAHESNNLASMSLAERERVVKELSRLILFRGLGGEAIDRKKIVGEVLASRTGTERIASAALAKAEARLREVFGFQLSNVPGYMVDHLSPKYRDRLYMVNAVRDDEAGNHSRAIHSVHPDAAVERGLLMLMLAFAFCRGESRNGFRWITATSLYQLLNGVDENIPSTPPSSSLGSKRESSRRQSTSSADASASTPDVDAALEKFVRMDYLLRSKLSALVAVGKGGKAAGSQTPAEEDDILYSMGPRAALEIGRKQVIYFCAEILDEKPDPTMLAEIEDDRNDGEEQASNAVVEG